MLNTTRDIMRLLKNNELVNYFVFFCKMIMIQLYISHEHFLNNFCIIFSQENMKICKKIISYLYSKLGRKKKSDDLNPISFQYFQGMRTFAAACTISSSGIRQPQRTSLHVSIESGGWLVIKSPIFSSVSKHYSTTKKTTSCQPFVVYALCCMRSFMKHQIPPIK